MLQQVCKVKAVLHVALVRRCFHERVHRLRGNFHLTCSHVQVRFPQITIFFKSKTYKHGPYKPRQFKFSGFQIVFMQHRPI